MVPCCGRRGTQGQPCGRAAALATDRPPSDWTWSLHAGSGASPGSAGGWLVVCGARQGDVPRKVATDKTWKALGALKVSLRVCDGAPSCSGQVFYFGRHILRNDSERITNLQKKRDQHNRTLPPPQSGHCPTSPLPTRGQPVPVSLRAIHPQGF